MTLKRDIPAGGAIRGGLRAAPYFWLYGGAPLITEFLKI
jgi:hypothetical protein